MKIKEPLAGGLCPAQHSSRHSAGRPRRPRDPGQHRGPGIKAYVIQSLVARYSGDSHELSGDMESGSKVFLHFSAPMWAWCPSVNHPGKRYSLTTSGPGSIGTRSTCRKCGPAPTQKSQWEQGLAGRTHTHGQVLLWGIRPALYLGCYETCFC